MENHIIISKNVEKSIDKNLAPFMISTLRKLRTFLNLIKDIHRNPTASISNGEGPAFP